MLANSYTQAKEDGQKVVQLLQKTRVCAEPREVPIRTHSKMNTPEPGGQHTEYDLVTSPGQGPGYKGTGSQSGLFPHMQRGDEATGLDKFCQYNTTTSKITLSPPSILVQGELQDSADLFKKLQPDSEAAQILLWWCTFKPQLKSISSPHIEAVVMTDASKEGYGGHINSLFFWGRWPAEKGKNTHINILELETV